MYSNYNVLVIVHKLNINCIYYPRVETEHKNVVYLSASVNALTLHLQTQTTVDLK